MFCLLQFSVGPVWAQHSGEETTGQTNAEKADLLGYYSRYWEIGGYQLRNRLVVALTWRATTDQISHLSDLLIRIVKEEELVSDTEKLSILLAVLEQVAAQVGEDAEVFEVLNYARNVNQTDVSHEVVSDPAYGWGNPASDSEKAFHVIGISNPDDVEKYSHPDGREAVFIRNSAGDMVHLKDGTNDATYNYVSNYSLGDAVQASNTSKFVSDNYLHMVLDVIPWLVYGVSPTDQTTISQRIEAFEQSDIIRTLQTLYVVGRAANDSTLTVEAALEELGVRLEQLADPLNAADAAGAFPEGFDIQTVAPDGFLGPPLVGAATGSDPDNVPFASNVDIGKAAEPAPNTPVKSPLGELALNVSAGFFDPTYPAAWNPPAQHLGTDLPAPSGTQVMSPVAGTVLLNRTERENAFEKYIIIRSAGEGHEHVFGHINSQLSEGDPVEVGTPLGTIVSAGTGPHVHWGINTTGVLESLGSGWGWGRAPLSATIEQATERGWINPVMWFENQSATATTSTPVAVDVPVSPDNEIVPTGEWGPAILSGLEGIGNEYAPCSDASDVRACLQSKGLSPQAIKFIYEINSNVSFIDNIQSDFTETGQIDIAHIEFRGASSQEYPVLLNGQPTIKIVEATGDLATTFRDSASADLFRAFPNATSRTTSLNSHRLLPNGRQRFVLVEAIVDGCRGCEIIGTAITFIEVEYGTGSVTRRAVGTIRENAHFGYKPSEESLFAQPLSLQAKLNFLGYHAGAIDGFPGPQTRQALMEFQVEHCLTPTGQPNPSTLRALVTADGFTVPCAGTNLPNGISANTPLLEGVYVTDPQICSSLTDTVQLYSVFSNNDQGSGMVETLFFIADERSEPEPLDGGCQIVRTDIVDGFTRIRGTCTGEEGIPRSMDRAWNIEANDRFVSAGAGREKTTVRCSNSSPLSVYHGFDQPREMTQVNDANGLQGCTPSGLPSFPERMRPVEDSSTHAGRTSSGKNWILRLFSPGLDFGDSQFTNSFGTTVDGLWRTTDTGICQSYNNQESWSCHDIFACEGETNRFVLRNSAGEFTSVIEASVGPSYELGAATGPEASSSSSVPFDFGVYATEERFCEIDEAEAVELGDAVGAVNRLIDESGWHRYESVCQPQSYTVNGDIVVMATLCSGEGSQWPSTMEVQRLSPTAFRDSGRTFRLCPTAQE